VDRVVVFDGDRQNDIVQTDRVRQIERERFAIHGRQLSALDG
jgi:hypothetical protein